MNPLDATAVPAQFPPGKSPGANPPVQKPSAPAGAGAAAAVDASSAPSGGARAKAAAPADKAVMEELRQSVADANHRLELSNQQIKLSVDQDTGAIVVMVTDRRTGETVRQIPSDEALKLRRNIDSLTGILVDKKS